MSTSIQATAVNPQLTNESLNNQKNEEQSNLEQVITESIGAVALLGISNALSELSRMKNPKPWTLAGQLKQEEAKMRLGISDVE